MDQKQQPLTKSADNAAQKATQTIIDNEAVLLCYLAQPKIVHHEFRRFVYGDEFRGVLERGLEVFQRHGACKWLSDDRRNGAITPADGHWALEDWSPRVVAAGWKYWAVVLPEKVFGHMNMKRWMETYAKLGVTAQAFTNPHEAQAWLEKL